MLTNLLSSAVEGAAYLIILFGLCFGAVVGVKLINRKLRQNGSKPEPSGEEENPASASKRVPPARAAARSRSASAKKRPARPRAQKIYYILERAEENKKGPSHEKAKTE